MFSNNIQKVSIVITLFFLFSNINGQNLVPNGSFEEQHDTTYCSWCQPWSPIERYVDYWFQPSMGTPDIYSNLKPQSCFASTISTNISSLGSQIPRTGNSYSGITIYTSEGGGGCNENYREYIAIKLPVPIFPNIEYVCYLFASLSDNSYKSTNNLGIFLSNSLIDNNIDCQLINTPTINSNEVISIKTGWKEIRDTFEIQYTANCLYIGNFLSNSQLILQNESFGNDRHAYYYIDDVTITPIYDSIYIDTICPRESFTINTINNKQYSLYRTEDFSLITTTNSSFIVEPTETSTFIQIFDSTIYKYQFIVLDQEVDLGIDKALCDGETLQLDASSMASSYLWQDNSTSPTYSITDEGLYWVAVTNMCGTVYDSINVIYNDIPIVNLGVDTLICNGARVLLDATYPNSTYLWQDGSTNPTYTAYTQGQYSVTVTSNNCSSTDTKNITTYPIRTIELGHDRTIEQGNSYTFGIFMIGASYLWSTGETTSLITVYNEGTYSIAVTDINGCVYHDSIHVYVNPILNPTVIGNQSVCYNDTVTYSVTTPYAANSIYSWNINGGHIIGTSNGIDVNEIKVIWDNPSSPNFVRVDITPNGSSNTASKNIVILITQIPEFTIQGLQHVCEGDTTSYYIISNFPYSSFTKFDVASEFYEPNNLYWDGLDSLVISKDTVLHSLTVNWKFIGNDKVFASSILNGCTYSSEMDIQIHPSITPNFTFLSNDEIYFEQEYARRLSDSIYTNSNVQFTNTTFEIPIPNINETNYSFLWDFLGDNSFVVTDYNPTFEYQKKGNYLVQLQLIDNVWGCSNTASKPITVFENSSCKILFPNTFTPQLATNNTFNACFNYGISETNFELSIYNRWGQKLWTSTNINEAWDGTYKGETVKQDVYIYQCNATCENKKSNTEKQQEIHITGDVTVLR